MQEFVNLDGVAAPLLVPNINTDVIIPKDFLKAINKSGLGVNLFDELRYLPKDAKDANSKPVPNPDFVLNFPQYQGASILISGNNFGCGSSREHAVWALQDFGIKCIIAPSFNDIFFGNCFKNGILPVSLGEDEVKAMCAAAERKPATFHVNLPDQTIIDSEGKSYKFDISPSKKEQLLNGYDEIDLTLKHRKEIEDFIDLTKKNRPWSFGV